jgi:hypothetical protein
MLASAYVPILTASIFFDNLQVQDMLMLNYKLDSRMTSIRGARISQNEQYAALKF